MTAAKMAFHDPHHASSPHRHERKKPRLLVPFCVLVLFVLYYTFLLVKFLSMPIPGEGGTNLSPGKLLPPTLNLNGVLTVGYCPGDNLAFLAKDVAPYLAKKLDREDYLLVPVKLNGEEQDLDFVMCERGSTEIVQRKLSLVEGRRLERLKYMDSSDIEFVPSSPNIILPPRNKPLMTILDDKERVVMKPFIIRFHMEPWLTQPAEGVDIAIDCKTAVSQLPRHVIVIHAPYMYTSFAYRSEEYHPSQLVEKKQIDHAPQRKEFMGFLSSYCVARVPSAIMRSIFFNLASEYFPEHPPEAIGNCQPRATGGRKPKFRLKPAPNLVTADMFKRAVEAYSKFKFVMAFENSQVAGYITEKIVNAKLAGAIPIYWGDDEVSRYLNPKAFVHCRLSTKSIDFYTMLEDIKIEHPNYSSAQVRDKFEREIVAQLRREGSELFDSCLKEIEAIHNDDSLYMAMLREPLINTFQDSVIDPEKYAELIVKVYNDKKKFV